MTAPTELLDEMLPPLEPASDLAAACRSVARLLRSGLELRGVWVVRTDSAATTLLGGDGDPAVHDELDWSTVGLLVPGASSVPAFSAAGAARVSVMGGHGEPVAEIHALAGANHPATGPAAAPATEGVVALIAAQADLLGSLFGAGQQMAAASRRAVLAEAEATHDHLTGVGNRRAWEQAVLAEEARCRRYGHDAAVLLIDLDGLKATNDTHGHEAGDVMLRAAASAASATVRPFDVVARLGGDEFAVLLSRCDATGAATLRGRLTDALDTAGVRASVGVGVRTPGTSLDAATVEADRDMYRHKAQRVDAGGEESEPARRPVLVPLPVTGTPGGIIDGLLERARHFLRLDLLFVGEWRGDTRYFRHLAADEPLRSSLLGSSVPLGETLCLPIVEGRAPGAIPDTRQEATVADLAPVREDGVRAHLGVPLELPSGEFYGTLCGTSFAPDPLINDRDLGFMHFLATVVAEQLGMLVTSARSRRAILERLDALMATGGPRIVFQPIVDLATDETVGFEALSRFTGGVARPPARWFEEAAEVGLDLDLELAALRAALSAWGSLPARRWLAVNVSPDTLRSPALRRLLAEDRTDGLVLELTGHAHVDEVGIGSAVTSLRALGARLAVDDGGAGYAGLARVLDLRPDVVKLDMALVRGAAGQPARRALARSFLSVAEEIGASVVAQGVERADERALLAELGVRLGQGYLLGQPAPAGQWVTPGEDRAAEKARP